MDFLKNLFKDKDKKKFNYLITLLFLGITLLIISSIFFDSLEKSKPTITNEEANVKTPETILSFEKDLEKRLEDTFSLVEGAGKVKVMITLTQGKEKTIHKDTKSSAMSTSETDTAGGQRTIADNSLDEQTVMVRNSDGSETPLVLVESEPKVEGVIIIAEGGNEVIVKTELTKAAQAVLGIEPHKIQVLKMKTIN